MSNPIEEKAHKYILRKFPKAIRSKNKTFDFEINGKYIEVKGKGKPFVHLDFISLTKNQYKAVNQKINFDVYLVCGLNTSTPEMYNISSRKLYKIAPRKIRSFEYNRSELKKIINNKI